MGTESLQTWELSTAEVSRSLKLCGHCSVPQGHLGPKPGQLAAPHLEQMAFLDSYKEAFREAGDGFSLSDQKETHHVPLRSLAQGQVHE